MVNEAAETARSLSEEFKRDPTIKNYLRLRSIHPDVKIEISISGGIEFAFHCEDLLGGIGLTVKDFLGLLEADEEVTSRVCLHLLGDMARAQDAAKNGDTHLSRRRKRIPEHAIDWLICTILDSESWNGTLQLNRDLAFLIKSRLQAGRNYFEQALEVRTNKSNAAMFGGQFKARGVAPSFRKVARLMKVQPSTVMRWFGSEAEFQTACEPYSHWFDKEGKLRPLRGIARAQRPTPKE